MNFNPLLRSLGIVGITLLCTQATLEAEELPMKNILDANGDTVLVVDWDRISWDTFGGVEEAGVFDFEAKVNETYDAAMVGNILNTLGYNPSRSWEAGDTLSEILMMGDLQDFLEPHRASIRGILNHTMTEDDFTLEDVGIINLDSDIRAIIQPISDRIDLESIELADVPFIRDAIDSMSRFRCSIDMCRGSLSNRLIPKSDDYITITNLDHLPSMVLNASVPETIKELGIDALGDFQELPIEALNVGWKSFTLDKIPGLDGLPLSQYPVPIPVAGAGAISYLDIPLGDLEANRLKSASGSNKEGYSVPCDKDSCPHIELNGIPGTEGFQWIQGNVQDVDGGRGILGVLNGGKEHTGRNPFGPLFKVTLDDVNEPEGKADFSTFFRFCKRTWFVDLGCTPYFIGPFPWFSVKEKDVVILGGGQLSDISVPLPIPDLLPVGIPDGQVPSPPVAEGPCDYSNFHHPYPGSVVTSRYGWRWGRMHNGTDLGRYSVGDPILAACPGIAYNRAQGGGYRGWGYYVEIYHGNGYMTRYAHLSGFAIQDGQQVSAGQVIGYSGGARGAEGAGSSRAPHLHLEVRQHGAAFDPQSVFPF